MRKRSVGGEVGGAHGSGHVKQRHRDRRMQCDWQSKGFVCQKS